MHLVRDVKLQHTIKNFLPPARKGHLRQTIHSKGVVSGPSLRTRETCQFPRPSLLPRRGAQGVTGQKWLDGSTQSSLGVVTLPQAPSCSFSAPLSWAVSSPIPLVLNPNSTIPTKPQPKANWRPFTCPVNRYLLRSWEALCPRT